MFDAVLRGKLDPHLDRAALFLTGTGVSATGLTLIGFLFGFACCVLVAFGLYPLAFVFLLLNRLTDGLDGCLARQTASVTDRGGYLDIVLDFFFYSGFVFAFQLSDETKAPAAAFLIFSFIGTSSSFLAYSVFAEKRKLDTAKKQRKSIAYLGGLTEGFETILCFTAMLFFPSFFPLLAYLFGSLCWLTAFTRVATAWLDFDDGTEESANS